MASHQQKDPGRTSRCQSRYVSNIASVFLLLLLEWLSMAALFLFRYSAIGLISKKVFMLNKNIVHLIDDISGIWDSKRRPRPTWLCNYINYTYFINYVHYTNYIAYTHYCRFVRILELRTTCGRRRERWLPNQLITWAISFVLLFVPDGFHTSVVCTHMMVRPMPALLWEKAPSSSKNESTPLLDATNIDHSWWIMQLACNLQWNPTEKATFCFGIMRIIEKIIAIIVT